MHLQYQLWGGPWETERATRGLRVKGPAQIWQRPGRLGRSDVEKLLRSALEQGELELHYQPQCVLATQSWSGLEVLLRWRSPVLGLVSAREFVGIAVASGDMPKIGQWVIRSAACQIAAWRADGLMIPSIAVNVSPVEVAHANFLPNISKALYDFGLEPSDLELEVKEPAKLSGAEEFLEKLTELHRLGIQLTLDGFGAGPSSLGFLVRVPFGSIKISGSVVRGVERTGDARQRSVQMLDVICTLGRRMQKLIAAGGVESELQRHSLVQTGCALAQGHLFAKSQSAEEIGKALRLAHAESSSVKQTLSEVAIVRGP